MSNKFDFSGWATKNDLRCSDGRTIRPGAFKDCDGTIVPLVWQHSHDNPSNVLGHALLENRDEGVYAYCSFNDSRAAQDAKMSVQHGDINALSIYANHLKQKGGDVLHGVIKEVSLVLSGANPGAFIDCPVLAHSDEESTEAIIYTGETVELFHEDADVEESEVEETEEVSEEKEENEMEHAEEQKSEKTVQDVIDTMDDDQKKVMKFLVAQALAAGGKEENAEEVEHSDMEGDDTMKHNVFENETEQNVLSHDDMQTIINDAKRYGSMKESVLAHSQEYGIENIEYLFPDAKSLNTPPEFIKRDDSWVKKFMNATHHTPFSRIKSMFADITEDEARAKGYIKGRLKKEEVFSLLKRVTTPTTVYKKQKMDRDDRVDITDFDVIAWLKSEMRMMLDEEIARAALIGDGRLASSSDKINEQNIRPIWTDADLYTVKVAVAKETDGSVDAKKFIKSVIRARKNYKGSGNPTLYTTEDMLTEMLLLEDGIGRTLYESEAKLATVLRVKEIVTVEVMEGANREVEGVQHDLLGIIVNPVDYNFGADKGGSVSMFEDFDIDYNQEKYLIETRCSGALVKPFSALAIEAVPAQQ